MNIFNSEKFLKEFSDEYSIPINTLSQWVQKYKKSNYDDSVLKTKKKDVFLLTNAYMFFLS